MAARPLGLPTVFGSELTLGSTAPANGVADPPGEHLLLLAEGPRGYAALARAISEAQLRGGKGAPRTSLAELGASEAAGRDWFVLTGCRKGTVPRALMNDGPAAARRELQALVDAFGRDRVAVELWEHGDPLDALVLVGQQSARHRASNMLSIVRSKTCRLGQFWRAGGGQSRGGGCLERKPLFGPPRALKREPKLRAWDPPVKGMGFALGTMQQQVQPYLG